jgi:hypothetical protein
VKRVAATLGRRGRPSVAAGTLTLTGDVDISNLEVSRVPLTPDEIAKALTEQAASAGPAAGAPGGAGPATQPPPPTTRWDIDGGNVRLDARFDDFAPDVDNVTGGDETMRATLRGTVRLRGPLPRPTLATDQREPLEIRNAVLRLPSREGTPEQRLPRYDINPRLNVEVALVERGATVQAGGNRVETTGTLDINGTLEQPDVAGRLSVQGGTLQLPTAAFRIRRGGAVNVAYRPNRGTRLNTLTGRTEVVNEVELVADDLTAETTLYVDPQISRRLQTGGTGFGGSIFDRGDGQNGSNGASSFANLPLPSTNRPTVGRRQRYRIRIVANGPMLDPNNPLGYEATSDPPLSDAQIFRLIGNEQQIALAAAGRINQAFTQVVTQAFSARVIPSLLGNVERSIATLFGLEEFAVEYNPDSPLTLSLSRRFASPLERFLFSYTRTLSMGRFAPGEPDPFDLSLTYEINPRLSFGFSTDEQRTNRYFLRGTFSF